MNFLPFARLTLESKLNKQDVLARLQEQVDPNQDLSISFFNPTKTKPYKGSATLNEFKITRVISYRNSFLTNIHGKVEQLDRYTRIRIRFKLPIFIIVFCCIWFGGVTLAFVAILFSEIMAGKTDGAFLYPLGMFLLGYLLVMGSYNYEYGESKDFFINLFEAKERDSKQLPRPNE